MLGHPTIPRGANIVAEVLLLWLNPDQADALALILGSLLVLATIGLIYEGKYRKK